DVVELHADGGGGGLDLVGRDHAVHVRVGDGQRGVGDRRLDLLTELGRQVHDQEAEVTAEAKVRVEVAVVVQRRRVEDGIALGEVAVHQRAHEAQPLPARG